MQLGQLTNLSQRLPNIEGPERLPARLAASLFVEGLLAASSQKKWRGQNGRACVRQAVFGIRFAFLLCEGRLVPAC